MPTVTTIAPALLILDSQNPRLLTPATDEGSALIALARVLEDKLAELAEHIVTFGIHPADPLYVIEAPEAAGRYIVLEGNRRVAALRALEAPAALASALPPAILTRIKELSKTYLKAGGLDQVQCAVFASREEASPWIELRHTGGHKGAGTVGWGADEAQRFKVRQGGQRPKPHTQALDFLEQQGALTTELRSQVPTTSLERLLGTPAVRERLGIDVEAGVLMLMADAAAVTKALMHVVRELASGSVPVKRIYTTAQREAYADQLPPRVVVKATRAAGDGIPAITGEAPAAAADNANQAPRRRKKRDRLLPGACRLNIPNTSRCKDIEEELRRLSLDKHTNAISVLYRVFLELSCTEYIKRHRLRVSRDSDLANKMRATAEDLVSKGKLTEAERKPITQSANSESFLAVNVKVMHDYVHNENIFPAAADLRNHWNSAQSYVVALWA